MDTQTKSFHVKLKVSKLKRSFQQIHDKKIPNNLDQKKKIFQSILFPDQFLQLKDYSDKHLFISHQKPSSISTLNTTKSSFSTQIPSKSTLQTPLKIRTNPTYRKLSYVCQRNQKLSKTERAKENLKNIQELRINHIDSLENGSLRFYKPYDTITQNQSIYSEDVEDVLRFAEKNSTQIGNNKSYRNRIMSPGKSCNIIKIKTMLVNNHDNPFDMFNSKIFELTKNQRHIPPSDKKFEKRKFSITPWDISQESPTKLK